MIFTNDEWEKFINGERIRDRAIGVNSRYKKAPEFCERWYNQNGGKTTIVNRCKNKPFYRTEQNGVFVCKECARAIDKIPKNIFTFVKIKDYIEL